ncbi:MAG: DegV family protein [Anaerolineales bacterium]|nr:DegV family protein [Chloroflexota bacterium]MBL6983637.1 DegV family protein [Anaerolineales bacterium]
MSDQKIAIVTDSSAYIPDSALEGLNVSVIPLWLLWEGQSFRDGVDIDPVSFYQRLRQTKNLPTSSQPTVPEFEKFFEKALEDADAIVNVLVSSKISGTIDNATQAIARMPHREIRLVDALSSSMGLGFCVLAAARAAASGESIDAVVEAAESMKERVHFLFVVDTLEYLHKGGRIGGAKRLMGTALKVKPILHFTDGQIDSLTSARTKRKALAQLLEIAEERLAGKAMMEAALVDIDSPNEGDIVANMVEQRFAPSIIHRSTVSPVVGTHVGPGAIGFAFYAEEQE